jgi:hypothetical protein
MASIQSPPFNQRSSDGTVVDLVSHGCLDGSNGKRKLLLARTFVSPDLC